ncbi:MAG: putative 2-aminoethylphosphonate ABC transporter permease subunit [Deltaproteobacteria bacterium]|nr:putative 2-aminoethylphosphonate ABC transporter permease subunit [Deltaproteobacteria bacterium]
MPLLSVLTPIPPPGYTRPVRVLNWESGLRRVLILMVCTGMIVAVVLPVGQLLVKSLTDAAGRYVGLANFILYFQTPSLFSSLFHSLWISTLTTIISVGLGLMYAYALTRSKLPFKALFQGLALVPLFAPTLLNGISLIYLFGKKGLVTTGFMGLWPGLDINLYGQTGIVISEVIYTFPQAVLILTVALSTTDARLLEASATLGASRFRTLLTVTLPGIKYALTSAVFVCFILAFTDFGAPKVVGGWYNVLATDIYKQVIGQQNFVMGAVVGVVLLVPTVAAFILDRLGQRRQMAMITAQSVPPRIEAHGPRDRFFLAFCGIIALTILLFYLTALWASLVKVWPYNLELGLWHYDFERTGGGGYGAFWNSLRMSLYTAVGGTILTFISAYLIEKSRGLIWVRRLAYFLSLMPLALPGLVIGLSYIFFFNAATWETPLGAVPNPFNFLYGTMGLLALSNIVHFYTVGFLTATTALKQLDQEFENVSEALGVSFIKTFQRVTIPVCFPAILEIFIFYFVNSMATVSAVIFLYGADLPVAAVAIANMDDAGDTAPACAMSVLIIAANALARCLAGLTAGVLARRNRDWTRR